MKGADFSPSFKRLLRICLFGARVSSELASWIAPARFAWLVYALVGATMVIVDVCKDTMLIDYKSLEEAITVRTKAVIPVSIFGNPLDYDILNAIKKKHAIYIIEDAACAIGAEIQGVKAGNWADISVFSLHPRKFITTGEGGVISTNNAQWTHWVESYKHFGMGATSNREGTVFERIGTNYKLSNVLAAIGLVQMRHIEDLLARRISLSENYIHLVEKTSGITIPRTTVGGKHSRQSFCLYVDDRDRIMKTMRETGIEVQIGTYALHMHPAFAASPQIIHHGPFEGSVYAYKHCLTLPLYHDLSHEEQNYVIQHLLREI